MKDVAICIPARYASSRFPGKPLALLGDKTMLETVYYNCLSAYGIDTVLIATDDRKIYDFCDENQMEVVMTSTNHLSGTDRIAEAIIKRNISAKYIINVQGDEPFLTSNQLDVLIAYIEQYQPKICTLYKSFSSDFEDPNKVKLVLDKKKRCMYFSRAVIPYNRKKVSNFNMHIGVYAFRRDVLMKIVKMQPTELEKTESLEQLRWLENGYDIYGVKVDYEGIGIDTPEDLAKAKSML